MGGRGSGQHYWHWWRSVKKTTVEDCLSLDANRWMREGILKAGVFQRGTWQWTYHGGHSVRIDYKADLRRPERAWVTLEYTCREEGGEPEPMGYTITLDSTVPRFGGLRWWFICPMCNGCQRVSKLYMPPSERDFGCRRCHDLTYTSCQEAHQGDALLGRIAANMGITLKEVKRALRHP